MPPYRAMTAEAGPRWTSKLRTTAKEWAARRRARARQESILSAGFRWKLAARLERLAKDLKSSEPVMGKRGVRLYWQSRRMNLGYPVYDVYSVRGGIHMGIIEWSGQWRRPKFQADPESVFDQQCIAEIFAMMKEFI